MCIMSNTFSKCSLFHFEALYKTCTDITLSMSSYIGNWKKIVFYIWFYITIFHFHIFYKCICQILIQNQSDTVYFRI